MKYIIDNDQETLYDIDDVCEMVFTSDSYDNDDDVRDWVNERNSSVEIEGYDFEPADVLMSDSYIWRQVCDEYARERAEEDEGEYRYEIENMEPGEVNYYNGYKVEAVDEYADDDDEDMNVEFNKLLSVTFTAKTISSNPAKVQMIK